VKQLTAALAEVGDFHAGKAVRTAHDALRGHISFMHRDRAMDGDVRTVCELVQKRSFLIQ
jgi:histidine ammonia-lyase